VPPLQCLCCRIAFASLVVQCSSVVAALVLVVVVVLVLVVVVVWSWPTVHVWWLSIQNMSTPPEASPKKPLDGRLVDHLSV
jgi:hypothetical protein